MDLAALFLQAFLAATILPFSSEVVLGTMAAVGDVDRITLLIVASCGNVTGSVINWLLGRFIERFRHHRLFPVSPQALERAQATFRRHGLWSLLFAWVPVIGDPLTVAAGMLRTPFLPFLILVTIGKVARYVVVLWLAGQL
ncbi:MAG: DedA family protein [Geminicoccaceae bacterium]|nr:DedA family protein [Geminicoccaceae bacterium]